MSDPYADAGVDVRAGDTAVELMRAAVAATHGREVLGGVGGFAGLWDASALNAYRRPLLATSTDGVGTKVAIAQALGRHGTIGADLVGMVVDDLVVTGATPLFMTDYLACGRVVPERVAAIVGGVADACRATGTALVGGETAEHPDLLGPDEYDLAGAATGVVEADALLGPHLVRDGDEVLALAASGLHSNGYSLVRRILADRGVGYTDEVEGLTGPVGDTLLVPTRLYTRPLLEVLHGDLGGYLHALSHVTGGGIAANLARVLPAGAWCEIERAWPVPPVFRVLADLGGLPLASVEGTWNLGVGMLAVVEAGTADAVAARLAAGGVPAWRAGRVSTAPRDAGNWVEGAKGVTGGAVRLTGVWSD